jgi:MFS family permease
MTSSRKHEALTMRRRRRLIWIAPLAILGMALFAFIGGELVKLLWNWLLPPLFGWREVTFWQALGLLALCRILFGGFGRHGYGRSNFRRRMEERYANMTPEERERLRQGMRARWGFGPSTTESQEP